jgi:hypothetical protein
MFDLKKIENGRMNVPEPMFLEAKVSEAISYGEALVLASGKLTKCGATTKPEFIALRDVAAADTDRLMPVCRVESNHVYDVPCTAAPTGLVPGSKVTINSDGLQVTATTSDGVATVISTNGVTAAGGIITVRF